MRRLESLLLAVVFLAYNIWFIGFLQRIGRFDVISQLLIAWFTCSVLLFGLYIIKSERKKAKPEDKPADLENKVDEKDRILIGKVHGKEVWFSKKVLKDLEELIPDEKERDKFILASLHSIARTMREGGRTNG